MSDYKQEIDRPTNPVRKFETGATRDTDNGKHDPEGFLHPLVIERFNEYMHQNRLQKDGSVRDSDNWQKGIPKSAYMKSMWRHFHDIWLHHRGYDHKAKEPLQIALCGLMFNVMGYLLETLKESYDPYPVDRSKVTQVKAASMTGFVDGAPS